MRRFAFIALIAMLFGCGSCATIENEIDSQPTHAATSETPENASMPTSVENESDETPFIAEVKAEVIDSVFYTVPEYYDGFYAAAVIKNTGNVMIEFDKYNCSFDIEDADGNFLHHIDNVTIEPKIIGGSEDEFAYMAALDLNLGIDLSKCARIVVNISYDSAYAIPGGQLQIEDVSFTDYSKYFYATPGRAVNEYQYDVMDVIPIIALYSQDNSFLGVNITSKPVSVNAGGKAGFSGEPDAPIPISALSEEDIGNCNIVATAYFYRELG